MTSRYIEVADSITIMDRLRIRKKAFQTTELAKAGGTAKIAIEVLRAIFEEVAGAGQPFSADSYLPAHLIHDARHVIEQSEREQEAK